MYNTQFGGQFGYNSMPTATQPYGYSINNMPNYIQPTQQQPTTINQLELQNAVAGVVRYPTAMTYAYNANPFCGCNAGCGYNGNY